MHFQSFGVGLVLATTIATSAGCESTGGDVLTPVQDGSSGGDGAPGSGDGSGGLVADATMNDAPASDATTSDARVGDATVGDATPESDGGDASLGPLEGGTVDGGGMAGGDAAVACGDSGQVCAPLQCTGVTCSCLVACDVALVQRSDGSLWRYSETAGAAPIPVKMQDGSLFLAGSFGVSQSPLACGVRRSDATAWCWDLVAPVCDAGSCSGTSELGNNSTTQSVSPVQVVTSTGTPLTNVASIAVALFGGTACAVDGAGGAWCWGGDFLGALGTGATTAETNFAAPVLTAGGGPPLAGVVQIATELWITCARKTDGTVWCWGFTNPSPLADGSQIVSFPVQVSLPAKATSINVDEFNACALLADTTVWCWATAEGGAFVMGATPTELLAAQGTPFVGALSVAVDNTVAHAAKSDGSVWLWYPNQPYAQPETPAVHDAFVLCQSGFDEPSYIDTNGLFHNQSNPDGGVPVSCP